MNLGKKYKQLFEGKTRSNDSRLLKESNVIKVTSHDEVYDDQIDYEGTINGKPWRAEQTHEGDEGEASYYTSVFDANEEELQETDPDAYDDVIAAINDYMEEEGLDPASSFGDD